MARLNIERQKELEPKRMEYALNQLQKAGIQSMYLTKENCIEFDFNGGKVKFWPYSG